MQKYNWSKDELEKSIKDSVCYSEVLRKLNVPIRGRNVDTLKNKIEEYNLDISHFTFSAKTRNTYKNSKFFLNKNSSIKSSKLKEKLFKDGLKENKCEICGISEWQNKSINCHLHHIDGDPTNNELGNLQILCPNCHAQTDTYSGSANKSKNKIKRVCIDCGKPVRSKSNRCVVCAAKHRRVLSDDKVPSKEILLDLIKTESFTNIAKKYGVSGNAIKKLCKRYNIPSTKYELGLREKDPILNKICPNCGKEYHPTKRTQICCGRNCQSEYAKYKHILDFNGEPIIDKDTFINYASTHPKQKTYEHFNITKYKYNALEYYFLNKN